jgi:site-specific recombinase XerD
MYCSRCISVCRQDQQLIQDFSDHLKGLRGCSKETALTYRQDLDQFASFLFDHGISLPEVTGQNIKAYLQFLETNGISTRTAVRRLYALGTFYRRLAKEKVISRNPTAFVRLKKNWSNKPRSRPVEVVEDLLNKARGRARGPHRSELARLLAIRNWAIIEFLYGSGVRREECCRIDLFDLSIEERTVQVHHGKGGKGRVVSITPTACEVLDMYQKDSRQGLFERRSRKHPSSRALFLTLSGTRMCCGTINRATKGMTPHEYRHSYAKHSTDNGASLSHVQEQLGHASPQTTTIYAGDVSFDQLKEAHKRFHPRRRKRGGEDSQDKESQQ